MAGWFQVDNVWDSLKPWVETPIDFQSVNSAIGSKGVTLILSENDQFTSKYAENAQLWKDRLNATVVWDKERKHFNANEEPTVLQVILEKIQS